MRLLAALVALCATLAAAAPATAHSARDAEPTAAPGPRDAQTARAAADPPLPRGATKLAARYTADHRELIEAIDAWLASGDPSRGEAPENVQRLAIGQQRIGRLLGRNRTLANQTLPKIDPEARGFLAQDVAARRDLLSIRSKVVQRPKIRIGKPEPAGRLRQHYTRAWRRYNVGFPLLAAVNFIESAFGKVRNESVSGAQGPMQFMPATWKAYGLGGDVNDPADAILGAANYLKASGAPRSETQALFAYNPSSAYVRAVQRYANLIRRDARTFYVLYARAVYIGGKRRSGPTVLAN